MDIEKLKKALKERERIVPTLAWKMMCRATENNYEICFLWKIPNEKYQEWYESNKKYLKSTLEEETTYIVHSGEKAFDGSKCGYSIFAKSLGDIINQRHYTLDRIERIPLEYAIDITDLVKEQDL